MTVHGCIVQFLLFCSEEYIYNSVFTTRIMSRQKLKEQTVKIAIIINQTLGLEYLAQTTRVKRVNRVSIMTKSPMSDRAVQT